ncbi:hypothetical protein LSAT2_007949 [Lamellibrachia satsuma]|nr:hypothetical protein LSAT2_007949 [Lamellibrachia satsuma]
MISRAAVSYILHFMTSKASVSHVKLVMTSRSSICWPSVQYPSPLSRVYTIHLSDLVNQSCTMLTKLICNSGPLISSTICTDVAPKVDEVLYFLNSTAF